MSVQAIGGAISHNSSLLGGGGSAASSAGAGFNDLLSGLISEANVTAGHSDQLVEQMAKGEPTDIHSVMVAMTEADLSFRMLVEVRNKLIDAYQEIQRMPV